MSKDFMSTQTGGQGETIQATPNTPVSPQDFDIKVNPPVQPPVDVMGDMPPAVPENVVAEQSVLEGVLPTNQDAPQPPSIEEELGLIPVDIELPEFDEELEMEAEAPNPNVSSTIIDTTNDIEIPRGIPVPEGLTSNNEFPKGIPVNTVTTVRTPIVKDEVQKVANEYKGTNIDVKPEGIVDVKKPSTGKSDGKYKLEARPSATYEKRNGKWYIDPNGGGKFFPLKDGDVKKRIATLENGAEPINSFKGGLKDGLYTYSGREGATYKKDNGKWYIDAKSTGKYMPISEGDVKKRISQLETGAKPVGGSIDFGSSLGVLNNQFGGLYGSANGIGAIDPVATDGMSFGQMTRGTGTKVEKYNADGTLNFNYDPKIAEAPQAARNIIDKPTVKKVTSTYNPLKAQTLSVTPESMLNKLNESLGATEEAITESTNEVANNFMNNDVATIYGDKLTPEQQAGMIGYQAKLKDFIGKDGITSENSAAVSSIIKDAERYFNEAKDINTLINTAASQNKTLDALAFENKLASRDKLLNTKRDGVFQENARALFDSSAQLATFINGQVEEGNIRWDNASKTFLVSPNLSEQERKFIEGKITSLNEGYKQAKDQRFEATNEEISKYKSDKISLEVNQKKLSDALKNVEYGGEKYKAILSQIDRNEMLLKRVNNKILDLKDSKSAFFLTEPKALAREASANMSASANSILSAIPKNITPKQKFDIFYRQLEERTSQMAKEGSFDSGRLDRIGQNFRDMLDWGGYFSLSDTEKEYFKNKALLNQLAPMYMNNDSGVSMDTDGFFGSFMNAVANTLTPNTSAAQGFFNSTEAARTALGTMQEWGFDAEDTVDKDAIKKLEERTVVDLMTGEKWGGFTGSTAGIIAPLLIAKKIPAGALRIANSVEKIASSPLNAGQIQRTVNTAVSAYNSALNSTKLGRFMKAPIKSAVEFELAAQAFGATRDELSWKTGLVGGAASEVFANLFAKIPSSEAFKHIYGVFGDNTGRAMQVLEKSGQFVTRGTVETIQEFSEELTNIYRDELRDKGFWETVGENFGSADAISEFIISSFIMGGAFGLGEQTKAKDLYNALPKEKKEYVNTVVANTMADINKAESVANEVATEAEQVAETQQKIEESAEPMATKEADKEQVKKEETKTESTAKTDTKEDAEEDFAFDLDVISNPDQATAVTMDESTEANPEVDVLFDLSTDDTKDEAGVSGEVGKGKEPIQAEPITETSQEATSPSGVVQEEQEVTDNKKFRWENANDFDSDVISGMIEEESIDLQYAESEAEKSRIQARIDFGNSILKDRGVKVEEPVSPDLGNYTSMTNESLEEEINNLEDDIEYLKEEGTAKEVKEANKKLKEARSEYESRNKKETKTEPIKESTKAKEKSWYVYYNDKTKMYDVIDSTDSKNQPTVKSFKRSADADKYAEKLRNDQTNSKVSTSTEPTKEVKAEKPATNKTTKESAPPVVKQTTADTEVAAKDGGAATSSVSDEVEFTPVEALYNGKRVGGYEVAISEDGKTATVKTPLQGVIQGAKIKTTSNGDRYVDGKSGTTVYIDKANISATKPTTKAEKSAATKSKKAKDKQAEETEQPKTLVENFNKKPIKGITNESSSEARRLADLIKFSRNQFIGEDGNAISLLASGIPDQIKWVKNAYSNGEISYSESILLQDALSEKKEAYWDVAQNVEANRARIEKERKANAKRSANTEKAEKLKEKVTNIAEGLKSQKGVIKSSISPLNLLPDSLRDKAIDIAIKLINSGIDWVYAVREAADSVITEEIIAGKMNMDDANALIDKVSVGIEAEKEVQKRTVKGIKLDDLSEEGKARGREAITKMSLEEIRQEGIKAVESGKVKPKEMIETVLASDSPAPILNAIETAAMVYHRNMIENQLSDAYQKHADAKIDSDEKFKLENEINYLEKQIVDYEAFATRTAHETGLSLRVRGLMLDNQYELARQMAKYRSKSKDGKIPEDVKQRMIKLDKELKDVNAKLAELEKKAEEANGKDAIDGIKNESKKKGKEPSTEVITDATGQIKIPVALIKELVEGGIEDINQLAEAVKDRIKDKHPDATTREVRDAISGYGRDINYTEDKTGIRDKISELKSIGRMLSNLEDLQAKLESLESGENLTGEAKEKNKALRRNLTEQERALMAQIKKLSASIPMTPEERKALDEKRLADFKKRTEKQIAELKTRLSDGDYSKAKKKEYLQLDEAANELRARKERLKFEFDVEHQKLADKNRTREQRTRDNFSEVWNAPKSLKSTADISAPFRQGIIHYLPMLVTNLPKAVKMFGTMLQFAASEAKYNRFMADIHSSEYYPLMQAAKLYLSEENAKLTAKEEMFMSNIARKIPLYGRVVAGSERAYVGFLNMLRADAFIKGVKEMSEAGININSNPEEIKAFAKYVNNATGRGTGGQTFEASAEAMGTLFFSPRFIKARLNTLWDFATYLPRVGYSHVPVIGEQTLPNPVAAKMAFKQTASFFGLASTILGVAWLAMDDDDEKNKVELDPRSTDFAKIKFGDTTIDLLGGFQQYVVFASRFFSNSTKSGNGKLTVFGSTYNAPTKVILTANLLKNKLSPTMGYLVKLGNESQDMRKKRRKEDGYDEDFFGEDIGALGTAKKLTEEAFWELATPIWASDVPEMYEEHGALGAAGLFTLGQVGLGVSTYERKKSGGGSSGGGRSRGRTSRTTRSRRRTR
jgi:hypothetical protein